MDRKSSWLNPVGLWQVSTEGDCEGRSMRTLGIFKGHYCDIALALADKSVYSLHFHRIYDEDMIPPAHRLRDKVQITFDDCKIGNYDTIVQDVRTVANLQKISVDKGMWNGHVTLYRPVSEAEKKQRALANARKNLSPEDLEVLGLA